MRVLLDTHTFLWWNAKDDRLSNKVKTVIENGENEVFVSSACAWEIAIKYAKGKLQLPESPTKYVASRMEYYDFQALPIHISHASYVAGLPFHHTDPFDRLLVAQGVLETLPILTADVQFSNYGVKIIW